MSRLKAWFHFILHMSYHTTSRIHDIINMFTMISSIIVLTAELATLYRGTSRVFCQYFLHNSFNFITNLQKIDDLSGLQCLQGFSIHGKNIHIFSGSTELEQISNLHPHSCSSFYCCSFSPLQPALALALILAARGGRMLPRPKCPPCCHHYHRIATSEQNCQHCTDG